MSKNKVEKEELKIKILKLKDDLYNENCSDGIDFLAHKYLNRVLDMIEEYRY